MSLPDLTPVKSSNIAAIGHRGESLFVKFLGGNAVYEYKGVPAQMHDDLLKSESISRHFSQHVKGKFTHHVHAL